MIIPPELLPRDGRFGSGPSRIPPEHLDLDPTWMGRSHRSRSVTSIVGEIRHGLRTLLSAPDGYEVVLGNGGASLVWDMLGFAVVESRAQALSIGAFSSKAAAAVAHNPNVTDVEVISAEPGQGASITPREEIDTYLYPQNETSTGVMLPVARPDGDGLVVVDATSAAGGVLTDLGATDVYYFSAQKCFAGDGGLWVALLSPAAQERIERLSRSRWIPDMVNMQVALKNSRSNQTLNTPALASLHLLHRSVTEMLQRGGLAWADERCRTSSELVYSWIASTPWAHGFAAESVRSQTVVTIDVDLPASQITEIASANGIVDIGGYRGLGRNQLRIATFPFIEPEDVSSLLTCLTWIGDQLRD